MWVLGFELEATFKQQQLLTGDSFFQVLECFALFLFDFYLFPQSVLRKCWLVVWGRGGGSGGWA